MCESGLAGSPTGQKMENKPPLSSAQVKQSESKVQPDASRLHMDTVIGMAQTIPNLPPITDAAASELALDAEYRLREIIQEALKFMRHSKREELSTNDINSATRLRNVKPMFGFSCRKRKRTATTRANPSLTNASPSKRSKSSHSTVNAKSGTGDVEYKLVEGFSGLYHRTEPDLQLKRILQTPLPPVPLEVTISAHWLAVEGKQPRIPQNPIPKPEPTTTKEEAKLEHQQAQTTQRVVIRAPLKHDLSRELQDFFHQATKALLANQAIVLDKYLLSISQEPGLAEMLPYLSQFIANTVRRNLTNLPVLFGCMRLFHATLRNNAFNVVLYLDQMLAAAMTCLVRKRIGKNPREDHWMLRDYVAYLLRSICSKYSSAYKLLQPRIAKTLLEAFDGPKKSLPAKYGAVVGLAALGRNAIDSILLPNLATESKQMNSLLNSYKPKGVLKMEVAKVCGAFMWAVSVPARPKERMRRIPDADSKTFRMTYALEVELSQERIAELLPEIHDVQKSLSQELGQWLYPFTSKPSV